MSRSRTWGLLSLAIVARVASLSGLNGEPSYRLVPRSLTASGFLVQPSWLDIAVPLVFIVALRDSRRFARPTAREMRGAALDALLLMAFPLLAGLSLFPYVQRWLLTPTIDGVTALRFAQFVLAFMAMNLFMDHLSLERRWARLGVALVLAGSLAFTQDLVARPDADWYRVVTLLSSVGTLLAATAWALRRAWREVPARALATAALVGGVACFIVVAARSDQIFPLFLPAIALLAGSAALRSASSWPRGIALAGVVSVGLGLSLLLPRFLSAGMRSQMEEGAFAPSHTEKVGGLTVSYDDPRVREVAVRMARVLDAANRVSRESFGVSPEVRRLTIGGIAPGGFFAQFPDGISGDLPSERSVSLLLDAAALNAPAFSAHDLDPVNAILHEYAHLYGVVPYMPWVLGPEEEGWATYAATRLSLRLYETRGAALWDPPYDYARRARAIAASNLEGRAVLWSHPDEFGGFRLWHSLGIRDGEEALFRKRWELTRRDQRRFLLQTSDPEAARRVAGSVGRPDLESVGRAPEARFGQAVSREDFVRFGEVVGLPPGQMRIRYDRRADQLIRPAVVVPGSRGALQGALAAALVGGALVARRRRDAISMVSSEGLDAGGAAAAAEKKLSK